MLAAAERSVLGIVAEQLRERARVRQVTIIASSASGDIQEVAHAPDAPPEPDAELRELVHEHPGGLKRFPRRSGGVHLAAAERHGALSVCAVGSSDEDAPHGDLADALQDLVRITARVLAETEEPALEPPPPGRAAGYAAKLGDAVAFLEHPPVLAESRARLTRALEQRHVAMGEAISAVETDTGLALAIVAAANAADNRRDGIASVPLALEVLGPRAALRVAAELPELRPLANGDRLAASLLRISAHSITTRAAASMIAREVGDPGREELRLVAALHDVGKVALAAGGDEYLRTLSDGTRTPEARLAEERRQLTLDHAAIGAVLLRRLGMPKSVAATVERHHADDASGLAAILRLGDMVAHQIAGDAINPGALASVARAVQLGPEALARIAYDLPRSRASRDSSPDPSPLTKMQEKVLQGLAEGRTYKEIAAELSLSESTVRTHLHNLYRKIGVPDRAQAVLLAVERGWI